MWFGFKKEKKKKGKSQISLFACFVVFFFFFWLVNLYVLKGTSEDGDRGKEAAVLTFWGLCLLKFLILSLIKCRVYLWDAQCLLSPRQRCSGMQNSGTDSLVYWIKQVMVFLRGRFCWCYASVALPTKIFLAACNSSQTWDRALPPCSTISDHVQLPGVLPHVGQWYLSRLVLGLKAQGHVTDGTDS